MVISMVSRLVQPTYRTERVHAPIINYSVRFEVSIAVKLKILSSLMWGSVVW